MIARYRLPAARKNLPMPLHERVSWSSRDRYRYRYSLSKKPDKIDSDKAREDHAEKFNHDMGAICADLKRIERECGHDIVSLPPRPLTRAACHPISFFGG
uniref:Uncharacterized protein n=1 Tax=Candidatus Kentrum sp. FM TaxID=2126340 RepID=A0A450TTR2_9GAMM|nr:MAG: hypothetical protein BECKFM1743C_GA0114222_105123 [Candidatus Kentron sp. FM]VFJ72064.1 MAG: hypothetical protein BECKFM1743A_GA0114220_106213 [Candidatus Kentron sp. FM]VFK20256.1 MAG: hypothetical protein BECKFM1743B_GA0114221_106814 [Candidatus Kentron sp. FM]